ncbi:MAG: beta-lactamase family protein [Hamadaea sp.]|uniref:serine hydrolase domain-containing protein n=1 Tax=Hamadaea sp. TaxID=2024425 RepID=UPI00183F6034|nr:serine hydrolase domain-containing protein [Hamadaea sp.]NUR69648.1 beta-lactamase family protein [Hamadaea sp.]NUT19515.1 beta-lactamase family protein [Hamadaea sp.]
MDEQLDRLLAAAPMPAVAMTVFDADSVRYRRVRGVADLTTGRPVTADTWWDLASLTKTLVTLPEVLARFDLDAPLSSVWPRAVGSPVGAASVRQLLCHTAGLPATVPFYRTDSDVVAQALAAPLDRPPGTEAVYSDLGFLLLGAALGPDLPAMAAARSGLRFGPVSGGEPAVATEDCPWRQRIIVGEVHDENAYAMGGVAGHAGAFGTIDLVTAAARAWFADAVVNPELHYAVRHPWGTNAAGERFGLGWWLPPTRGLGGPRPGPGSYGCSGFVGHRIWFEPAYGYGVVILSNRIHPRRDTRPAFNAWCDEVLAYLSNA